MAWLSGWSYRKEISITGQSGAGTNYQVPFSIGVLSGGDFHIEDHCTNFPQDIAVTDNDGTTLLDFWIEDITAEPIKMWVKVADDLGSNQTVYIYYGKSGASSNSNGVDTFPFFDDFNDDSIDTGKWNTDGSPVESGGVVTINSDDEGILGKTAYGMNHAVRGRCNLTQPSTGQYGAFGWSATLDGATPYETFSARPTPTLWAIDSGSNYSVLGTSYFGSYHVYEVARISTSSHKFFIDDVEKWDSIESSSANLYPIFYLYTGNITHTLDWVLVRKYIATEPAFSSAGSEETPPTGAVPTGVFYGPLVGPLGGPI